jgi:hypothetical protein
VNKGGWKENSSIIAEGKEKEKHDKCIKRETGEYPAYNEPTEVRKGKNVITKSTS